MCTKNIFNDEPTWQEHWQHRYEQRQKLRICQRCVFDETIKGIGFDKDGVCNYCRLQEDLESQFPGGQKGWEDIIRISEEARKSGRNRPYDVIVGVSGGADSSYMLHLAKVELGLRPLAVHFDNTWNSTIATNNIKKVTTALDIDLYTHVVDNQEFDDSCKAFLKAGVPDLDIQTDLGLAATLNKAAIRFGIKYVFEGHSFRSEGICPSGLYYMDSKYIESIQKKYGTRKLTSLPHMWLSSQLKWMLFNRLKKIRPLWYIDYQKENCKAMLSEKYGWEWYGGHHLENRITAFLHTYFHPRRWDNDLRCIGYSGLIRSGQMNREEALTLLRKPPSVDLEIIELVKKRLSLTDEQFVSLMQLPKRSFREFKTYKRTFERMRPFFYLMAKWERIPWSFYMKYTAKDGAI